MKASHKLNIIMKTVFERLHDKLLKDLDLDVINLKRTRAGIHMRNSGAFVWRGNLRESHTFEIGGCEPAINYLKKGVELEKYSHNQLSVGDLEIIIKD